MPSDQPADLAQIAEATVPCGPEAPFLARRTVSCWLDGRTHAQLHEDACLLVSELVTNSVRHAGQPPARRCTSGPPPSMASCGSRSTTTVTARSARVPRVPDKVATGCT
jgi:hypothetical protein